MLKFSTLNFHVPFLPCSIPGSLLYKWAPPLICCSFGQPLLCNDQVACTCTFFSPQSSSCLVPSVLGHNFGVCIHTLGLSPFHVPYLFSFRFICDDRFSLLLENAPLQTNSSYTILNILLKCSLYVWLWVPCTLLLNCTENTNSVVERSLCFYI